MAKPPKVNNIHTINTIENDKLIEIMEFDYLGKHYKCERIQPYQGNEFKLESNIKVLPNNDLEHQVVSIEHAKIDSETYNNFVEYWDKAIFNGDSLTLVQSDGYAAVFTPVI